MENTRWILVGLIAVSLVLVVSAGNEVNSGENLDKSQNITVTLNPSISTTTRTNCTSTNGTESDCNGNFGIKKLWEENKGMIVRTLCVLMGVTAIVIICFGLKYWRLRRKRRPKKYGIVTSASDNLELQPLDYDEEEDEDMTVFQQSSGQKKLLR